MTIKFIFKKLASEINKKILGQEDLHIPLPKEWGNYDANSHAQLIAVQRTLFNPNLWTAEIKFMHIDLNSSGKKGGWPGKITYSNNGWVVKKPAPLSEVVKALDDIYKGADIPPGFAQDSYVPARAYLRRLLPQPMPALIGPV